MLNKEKYAKEILDIVCQDGTIPAVVNNVPIKCTDALDCYDCKFYYDDDCINAFINVTITILPNINRCINRNFIPINFMFFVF